MKHTYVGAIAAFLLLLLTSTAQGQGFVLVEGAPENHPVQVESVSISAKVSGLTARVRVEEVLRNTTARDIEATFLFPVPEGSAFQSFAMSVGDQTVEGNLTDAGKAAEIYRGIVSKLKDPGLLQFLGCCLYRFNIYPLPANGKKTISFQYVVLLERKGESALLTIPLKSSSVFRKPVVAFSFSAEVQIQFGISSISSTSYDIGVAYRDGNFATVQLARNEFVPERDLDILIQSASASLNSALITCGGEDGDYFCVEISPGRIFRPDTIEPKDVTYILDISGSMSGCKIEAAKEALKRSVALLNQSDRFRLVVFENDARFVVPEFEEVCEDAISKLADAADKMGAGGGTNMEAGLRLGLAHEETGRLHYAVLISDGEPNIGIFSEAGLTRLVKELLGKRARLFTLGVGEAVNLFLLDQMAIVGGGFSDFVPETAFVADKIVEFMKKMNFPVLEDVNFSITGTRVWDLAPEKLTAVFAGNPIRLFGRFDGNSPMRLTLTGRYLGREETLTFDFDPSRDELHSPDLPFLWASRRAAALLDRMRLEGEEELKELKDEVTALASRFGIVTPFTSYLVTENGQVPQDVKSFLEWWNSNRGSSAGASASSGITTLTSDSSYKMFGCDIILANRILFVIDSSGSMSQPCGGKGEQANLPKFELLRRELKRVVKILDRRSSFNIVTFNQDVRLWQTSLVPATPENCADAVRFLDSLSPSGETHMAKVFEKVFEFTDVEAIYFVSDGEPWEGGKPADPKNVLDRVEFLNRFQKATVNTVGFEGASIELMRSLARAHDGTFRFIGEMKVEPCSQRLSSNDPLSKFPDTPEIRIVRKLIKQLSRSSLDRMMELAKNSKEIYTVRAVKSALRSLDSNSERQIVCSFITKTSDYRERVVLAEVIGTYLQCPDALDSLGEVALREKALPALKTEVIALSNFHDKKAVRALANVWLAFENNYKAREIVDRARKAIETITGVSGISSAADFLKWWEVAQASFNLPQAPGSAGIRGQKYLGRMRTTDTAEGAVTCRNVVHMEGKTFVRKGDEWVDTAYKEEEPLKEIVFLSEEYWQLAKEKGLKKYLAVAPRVIICVNGQNLRIILPRNRR
jgi:Ca-activated chloride channel family protein